MLEQYLELFYRKRSLFNFLHVFFKMVLIYSLLDLKRKLAGQTFSSDEEVIAESESNRIIKMVSQIFMTALILRANNFFFF